MRRQLGFVLSGSAEELFQSLASSPGLERSRLAGRGLLLAPGENPSEPQVAIARLDQERLVFGSLLGVLEAIDRFSEGTCEEHAKLEGLFEAANTTLPVWGVVHPDWLDFELGAQVLDAADVGGRSFSRSLSRLRGIVLSAEVSREEARLTVRTRAHDIEDARILSDELMTFVSSATRAAPDNVKSSLKRAQVVRADADVICTIPLDAAALSGIRRSQTGRNLLRWRLGAERREQTARIASVIDFLGVGAESRVADVGAGEGFFTVRLARAVGAGGRVYAVDIQEDVVEALEERAKHAELENVTAVLGAPEDPHLPRETLDAVLIVNAYHEMQEFEPMLVHIRDSLKADGRLVLVEPFDPERRSEPREAQVERHEISPEIVEAELREHGFQIVERIDAFILHEGSGRRDSLIVAVSDR